MNLRSLALAAAPPNPYRVVVTDAGDVQLTDAAGALVLADGAPAYSGRVSGVPAGVAAEVACPSLADLDPIRNAAGLKLGKGGTLEGNPSPVRMAVEAGIRLLKEPGTGKPWFTSADRDGLLSAPANGIGRRVCEAAFAVYQLADQAGNGSGKSMPAATTPDASSGGSPESSG